MGRVRAGVGQWNGKPDGRYGVHRQSLETACGWEQLGQADGKATGGSIGGRDGFESCSVRMVEARRRLRRWPPDGTIVGFAQWGLRTCVWRAAPQLRGVQEGLERALADAGFRGGRADVRVARHSWRWVGSVRRSWPDAAGCSEAIGADSGAGQRRHGQPGLWCR